MNSFHFLIKLIRTTIAFSPWLFLISFYSLLLRFKYKYNSWPTTIHPIESNYVGMKFHKSFIDLSMLFTLPSILFIIYLVYLAIKSKKISDILLASIAMFGLILCVIFITNKTNSLLWYWGD